MSAERRVWFITGAGRGMGSAFSRAALESGDAVVATGRRPDEVGMALGEHRQVLAVRLDVSSVGEAQAAVEAAMERFGRIDVVVNSAGASFKGYFEEMSPAQVDEQLATNLLGPMNVTRAVLPVMRAQRSGHLIAISSGAGLMGFEYSSVYAASKAGLEGWMGAVEQEVAPFGIRTTIVNPGWFRTSLASPESLVAGRRCRSTTTPSAAPPSEPGGPLRTDARQGTPTSSPEPCWPSRRRPATAPVSGGRGRDRHRRAQDRRAA